MMRVKTLMLIKTANTEKKLGLHSQADVDIGAILDILDSVSKMDYEQNVFRKIN